MKCISDGKKSITTGMLALALLPAPSPGNASDKDEDSPVKVRINGAPRELRGNLEAFLPTRRNLTCDSTQRRMERYTDASYDNLAEGAQAMGYFSAQFNVKPVRKKKCWLLSIDVKPGKTVEVARQDIKILGPGRDLPAFQEIIAQPPYRLGDRLVSQKYDDYKTSLKRTANALGFFDADMSRHTIRVNPETRKADIQLTFDTGERYRIGKISIEQEILAPKYINRYIQLKEGKPFRSEELIKQQNLLENSGYYKGVQVRAGYDEATNQVIPVTITAPKRKRYTYKGAIGFATNDGFYVETSMDAHWVNKKGHQLNATSRISQKDPALTLNYRVPLWNPEHEYLNYSLGWNRSDNNDIVGEAFKLGLDYHRRTENDWQQTASISYLDERTKVDNEPANRSQLTLLGLNTNKTQSDHPLFPTKGWRLEADLSGAAEGILSDQSVLQAGAGGKYLHTFGNEDKILLRGDIATTFIGDFDQLPKSLRYFAGGQNSVRGYSFESLGETDADSNVIGGEHLLTMSAEYERPIKNNISAAVFVDTGNAFNDWGDYKLKTGYGAGLRYKSPLGPIRLDLAVPEDDNTDLHIYFSLGPDL